MVKSKIFKKNNKNRKRSNKKKSNRKKSNRKKSRNIKKGGNKHMKTEKISLRSAVKVLRKYYQFKLKN